MQPAVEQSLCGDSWAMNDDRGRSWPSTVPGCAHADLIRAEEIPNPDAPQGESAQEWVGRTTFTWKRKFRVAPEVASHARIELVFERIDTVAQVRIDGELVLACASEFHPQRVDLTAVLAGNDAEHDLEVTCVGPVAEVERLERELGTRPVNGDWTPYPFMRKTACEFGWDWGPKVPSSGIRGLVYLHGWTGARIESVRPLVVECNESRAQLDVHVEMAAVSGLPLEVRCELVDDGTSCCKARATLARPAAGDSRMCARLEMNSPRRWWPRGHGGQHLYRLDVVLLAGGEVVDRASRRIGLRTVELDTRPAAEGSAFAVRVNGKAIWCAGANWIPDGLFSQTADAARVRERLEQACEANFVMVRVWGGGGYESDHFYDACDELGLLVWQDFAFACATYPEDSPFPARIEEEARYQIARLASHACIALWCGGNENILAWASWGFRERLREGQSWGRQYWLELLPRICAELDPSRPYWPDSPWSGSLEIHPNDPARGDRHTWEREARLEGVRSIIPRFCSEFGHQSPPALITISQAIDIDERTLSEMKPEEGLALIQDRQRATGGDEPQYGVLAERFPPPEDFATWIVQAQVMQARATRLAFSWLRANAPRCMGALVWQLNDAWTGHSWSLIDVRGRPKLAWYAARVACAPRALSIHPGPDGLVVSAVNDTDAPWRVRLELARHALASGGVDHRRKEPSVEVPARSAIAVGEISNELVGALPSLVSVEAPTGLADDPLAAAWHATHHERDWPTEGGGGKAIGAELSLVGLRGIGTDDEALFVEVRAATALFDAAVVPRGEWRSIDLALFSLAAGDAARVQIHTGGQRCLGIDLYTAGRRIAWLDLG